jgi:hypothetical protein
VPLSCRYGVSSYDLVSDNEDDMDIPASMAPEAPDAPSSEAAAFEPVTADFRGYGAKLADDVQRLCAQADTAFKHMRTAHGSDDGPSIKTVIKQKYGTQVGLKATVSVPGEGITAVHC